MGIVAFDTETASADQLFTYGPGFVRLAGADPGGKVELTADPYELVKWLNDASWITGSNIFGFDLLALAHYYGADWEALAAKAIDTTLLERLRFPPMARDTGGSEDKYDLDHIAERLGVRGKTDNIKALARKHGGYDQIPLDDPDYRAYLAGDVEASRAVFNALKDAWTPYAKREHKVASIFGRMTLNGFRVDVPLLRKRLEEGEERKQEALHILSEDYDLPLGKLVWKGRKDSKTEYWQDFTSPLSTQEGHEWLADVWEAYGINNPPLTETKQLSMKAEVLQPFIENEANHPDLRRILDLMATVTTTRTVYQTVRGFLTPEGRVHPLITMNQASGRSGVTSPGLTVFGKRDGRWVEREIFLPEEGHVLVSFDMKQLDFRAVAGLSQDPAYMEICNSGEDIHTQTAVAIFGDASLRSKAKAIVHGANYGMGANRLIRQGHDAELVKRYFTERTRKFPGVEEWQARARAEGAAGHLLDNGFGRKMRCDPQRAYTQAPALEGQGAAADIMKKALLQMPPEMRLYYRMYVHDEVVFSFPAKDADELSAEAEKAMTFEWRGVKILCDKNGPGENWGRISAH